MNEGRWRLSGNPHLPGRIISVVAALCGALLGACSLIDELDGARRFEAASGLSPGTLAEPSREPRRYEGVLRGPARTAPSGAPATFWLAWVTAEKRKHMEREVCRKAEADGLSLEVGAERVPFSLPPERVWATYVSPNYQPDSIAVDVEVPRNEGQVPSAMAARCPNLAELSEWTLTYREARLQDGARVVVGACHDGDRLGPCPGGQSFVAERGAAALLLNMRDAVLLNVTLALVVAVSALFGAGLWSLRRPAP